MHTTTLEDALEELTKKGLPPEVDTIEERVNLGLQLELLPRRERRDPLDHNGASYLIGPVVLSSYSQYKRARVVVLTARSTLRHPEVIAAAKKAYDAMVSGVLTVSGAYDRFKKAEKAFFEGDPGQANAAGLDRHGLPTLPPPMPNARSPKARLLRMEWMTALAAQGATSGEIAERLNIGVPAVRKMARDAGLTIPADMAMAKTPRRVHDPERVMTMITTDLEALVWSLERVDPAALDPAQAAEWATQLQTHASTIRRAARRISKKENDQ